MEMVLGLLVILCPLLLQVKGQGKHLKSEQRREKTCLRRFRPGPTQQAGIRTCAFYVEYTTVGFLGYVAVYGQGAPCRGLCRHIYSESHYPKLLIATC